MKRTKRVVVFRTPDNVKINIDEIPKHEMDAFCRSILNLVKKDNKHIAKGVAT